MGWPKGFGDGQEVCRKGTMELNARNQEFGYCGGFRESCINVWHAWPVCGLRPIGK